MFAVTVIQGESRRRARPRNSAAIADAVRHARRAGFVVGADVLLGTIEGRVIGYNVAGLGIYHGSLFPLLVATEYGLAKCAIDELTLLGQG